jgi:hypothetical protein
MKNPTLKNIRLMLPLLFLSLTSCVLVAHTQAYKVRQAQQHVRLGMSTSQVLGIMPERSSLAGRIPSHFLRDGHNFSIYYYRSSVISDHRTTDDELTPFVFMDDKLVGIGWDAVGGPKTFGDTDARMRQIQQGVDIMKKSGEINAPPAQQNLTCIRQGVFVNCN